MSNIILGGGTSGSGSVTLQAPNTNSNQTVNIPDRAGNLMMNGPAFSAYMSAATPVSNNTWTKLRFNTIQFDTASCYDTTNYKFTPNVAGYYQINFQWRNGSASSGTYFISRIYKNGSAWQNGTWAPCSSTSYVCPVLSTIVYLNGTTDYVEAYCYQTSGSGFDTDYDYLYTFNGCLMRGA